MENAIATIALEIAKESPALAMAGLIVLVAVLLATKVTPSVVAFFDGRSKTEAARESRKARESHERSTVEGQWIEAMRQANENSAEQNKLNRKLIDKLDRDEEQSNRLESKVCDVHEIAIELKGMMK